MNLASISENRDIEKRIAITPEIAKKYISLGFNLKKTKPKTINHRAIPTLNLLIQCQAPYP